MTKRNTYISLRWFYHETKSMLNSWNFYYSFFNYFRIHLQSFRLLDHLVIEKSWIAIPSMAMTSEPKFQMSIILTKSMLRIQKTIRICREPWKIRLLFERIFYRTISLYCLPKDYNSVDFYVSTWQRRNACSSVHVCVVS